MYISKNARKSLKKTVAVVLAALLAASFAACGTGPADSGGMNGKAYERQSFDGASMQNGLNPAINSAGDLVTASQVTGRPVVLTTWDSGGKRKATVTTDVTDPASMLALNSRNEAYILATPQGGRPTVHVLDASGKTASAIAVSLQPQGGGQTLPSGNKNAAPAGKALETIIGMQPAPDGGVFISAVGSGVMEFHSSGKKMGVIATGGVADLIALNGKNQLLVYSMQNGEASVKTFDASNGKFISAQDVSSLPAIQSFFYDKAGKRLLIMTPSDIRALSADGKTSAALAAFTDFSLIDGQRQLMGFAMDGHGTIYLASYNAANDNGHNGSGANETIRLALADASAIRQKKTLTVAALADSQLLDQVIAAFQAAHPHYRVVTKIYCTQANGMQKIVGPGTNIVSMQGGASRQDMSGFIQAVNTDLMSGNGADVIVLDGLPWFGYANKGVLADLGQMMSDKKFDTSPYYTNILDGCKAGGKLCAFPAGFSYTMLSAKAEYMPDSANPTLADFLSRAKALPRGAYPFQHQDATLVFESIIQFCYPELVDSEARTARFDSPEFIRALKDFKGLTDENSGPDNNESAQIGQVNGDVAYAATEILTAMDVSMERAVLGGDMKMTNMPTLGGNGSGFFSPSLLLGVNAGTKDPDAAWNFIETMLGSGIQGSEEMDMLGFPMLKSAAQKKIDDMHTGASLKGRHIVISLDNKRVEAQPLTDADYQSVLHALPSLNTLQYADPNVMNILGEELPAFFSGQKHAEEAASLIQNRVNTLLKE